MIHKALTQTEQNSLTPDMVLNDLMDGNRRFMDKNMSERDLQGQRQTSVSGQFPKAVVLSCIDSRVPVEMVFDQGIGDLFVARVAGNFENVDIIGSIEYSCKVAGSKLVMVLGHEACGAVKAACDGVELGNITALLSNIKPAVALSTADTSGATNSSNSDFVAKVVENNVRLTIERIRQKSPILAEMESEGAIKFVGGVYSLSDGSVSIID